MKPKTRAKHYLSILMVFYALWGLIFCIMDVFLKFHNLKGMDMLFIALSFSIMAMERGI